jgi:drug/metabolite transporter (DMT)-like permease
MLGEHLKWRDLLGVLLAIVGAVTVVISAKDSNPSVRAAGKLTD